MAADDAVDACACVFVMKYYSDNGFINVGTGTDVTIAGFADLIAKTIGYNGTIKLYNLAYRLAWNHVSEPRKRADPNIALRLHDSIRRQPTDEALS
jgi:nucleoside-diphosphate-sugar epimerase